MRQPLDVPCPGCGEEIPLQISVNQNGNQSFLNGDVQRKVSCDDCGAMMLVTLLGAGSRPSIARIPLPAKQNREWRRHR